MKVLVVGSAGQLGQALAATVPGGVECVGADLPDLDITHAGQVVSLCRQLQPDVVINAAAYTAVDRAESDVEVATAVNVDGPRNIAQAAGEVSARVIHISTDFVFDGNASTPYDIDAPTNPLSVYGRTKRDGETAVLEALPHSAVVVRTAWLYSKTGQNFVKTMLRLMAERDELRVVADQVGAPTWANSLAAAVWGIVKAPATVGVFHWTDGGSASWYEFAVAIQETALELGLLYRKVKIDAIASSEYPTAATRPAYSVLDCSKTIAVIGMQQADWRRNLRLMLEGMVE
jgi:dTDP-4-dehydrorhamnose reductase